MIALVSGGAASGKSAYAESLCLSLGKPHIYLAAMQPFGDEGAARVRKHRAQRAGKGFTTIECHEDLGRAVLDERLVGATVLLEDLGNVAANALFDSAGDARNPETCKTQVLAQIELLAQRCENLVVVANELGSDGAPYPPETRAYQELVGALTCAIAAHSRHVVMCEGGIPHVLKGSIMKENAEGGET